MCRVNRLETERILLFCRNVRKKLLHPHVCYNKHDVGGEDENHGGGGEEVGVRLSSWGKFLNSQMGIFFSPSNVTKKCQIPPGEVQ